jgi:predicted Zn-ribbon and HTH transcriptional regulator
VQLALTGVGGGGGGAVISVTSPRLYLRCDGTRLNVITLCRKISTALRAPIFTKLRNYSATLSTARIYQISSISVSRCRKCGYKFVDAS